MKRSDLPKVLNLTPSVITEFWKEVYPKYLEENEQGLLIKNNNIFIKGFLKNKDKEASYKKCFIKWIRQLYAQTEKRNHKHLGYVFSLLPYINIEYNMLCFNPDETDLTKIEHMSLLEFCNAINYNSTQVKRLLKLYQNIVFDVENHKERFISVVGDGVNLANATIYINPHIIYSGTNPKALEPLASFCQMV